MNSSICFLLGERKCALDGPHYVAELHGGHLEIYKYVNDICDGLSVWEREVWLLADLYFDSAKYK